MTKSSATAISEMSTLSTERTPRVSDACFNDWKRFCFVLREIASGEKGSPLSGVEAHKRAQAILSECGYTWPSSGQMREPVVAPAVFRRADLFSRQTRFGFEGWGNEHGKFDEGPALIGAS
jgi:hypothetical protein